VPEKNHSGSSRNQFEGPRIDRPALRPYSLAATAFKRLASVQSTENHGPLRIPPPLIYAVIFLLGVGLNRWWPIELFPPEPAVIVGNIIVAVSVLMLLPVFVQFYRARTSFDVRKPATTLITDGAYRFSRNPAYVSLTLLYLGLAVITNKAWVLLLIVPALAVMNAWVVPKEERHLEEQFGERYRQYKANVRRWL
jgi:protein-S-isoprenylcysteine O-methyltransferase Ste14